MTFAYANIQLDPHQSHLAVALIKRISVMIAEGRNICAIKEVRAVLGLGLKEAKDLVDGLREAGRDAPMHATPKPSVEHLVYWVEMNSFGESEDNVVSCESEEIAVALATEYATLSFKHNIRIAKVVAKEKRSIQMI